jgi:predicted acylesterase/phospholipase RssA
MIRHLVISGGGQTGFTFYGVLREAHKQGYWDIENIKSIYGTSVGMIVSVILCLKYDWETVDNYLINRPWHTVFKFDIYSVIQSFEKRGIFTVDTIAQILIPLFAGKDVPVDITLADFYALNGIDLRFFATEVNGFKVVDISHKTHPDWRVIDAVYCSSTLPIIFAPHISGDECFVDGGVMCGYPIRQALDDGINPDEIFALKKHNGPNVSNMVTGQSSLFDFLMIILRKTIQVLNGREVGLVPNEILITGESVSIDVILDLAASKDAREKLINFGVELFTAWRPQTASCALPLDHSTPELPHTD